MPHPRPAPAPAHLRVPLLDDVIGYDVDPDPLRPMLDHNQERIRAAFTALAGGP